MAFKGTELMYDMSDDFSSTPEAFVNNLKSQKDFDLIDKSWIESPQFSAIYERAIELFA